MGTWQFVHSDLEIDDLDDASSVSSGWSVMGLEEVNEEKTELRTISSDVLQGDASHPLPSSCLSHKRRRGGRRRISEHPPGSASATFTMATRGGEGANSLMLGDHGASAVLRSLGRVPVTALPNRCNRVAQFNRHKTAMNADRQHTKCLIGGAMTSRGYQRQQQFRTFGGQILRGHKARA